jgi:hypothetical protein
LPYIQYRYKIRHMNIEKSYWSSNGDNISLSVPFTKVDREKRTVSGFATLDNVDQTGDVVTAEASMKAFERFRGNIREMHGPNAVGKMVSFKPETFYDPKSNDFYSGVYVDAYISKGAQDTWEKILDGTLAGFSIGGKIKESDNQVNKATGQTVRFIKEYSLMELSVVDSPANELCNILSIEKMNGQLIFKGISTNLKTENIFYCEDSDSVFMSTDAEFNSPITGKQASLIGWVETDDINKAKEIEKILASFKKSRLTLPETQTIAKQANAQGGNEVSENTETAVVEETAAVEVEVVAEATIEKAITEDVLVDASAEIVEKATDISDEIVVEKPDFAKMLGDLKGFFSETLNKASEENAAQVTTIKNAVEILSKSVESKITELAEQHSELSKTVENIRNTIDGVEKRVDAVESETAIKKSSDLGGSREVKVQKSKWNGSFLGSVNELTK